MRHFQQNGAILLMKFCSRKAPFSTDWRQLESHFGSQLMTRLESHYGSCFVSLFESHFAKVAIVKRPIVDLATIFKRSPAKLERFLSQQKQVVIANSPKGRFGDHFQVKRNKWRSPIRQSGDRQFAKVDLAT